MTFLGGKKGNSALDVAIFVVILIVLFFFTLVGKYAFTEINTEVQALDDMSAENKAVVSDLNTRYPDFMDTMILVAAILLWCVVLVSAFMIDSHPVFFIFMALIMVAVFVAAAMLSNSVEEILSGDTDLLTAYDSFPITKWIIQHLLELAIVVGSSTSLVLFAKLRGS